jgi:hypothetical protein
MWHRGYYEPAATAVRCGSPLKAVKVSDLHQSNAQPLALVHLHRRVTDYKATMARSSVSALALALRAGGSVVSTLGSELGRATPSRAALQLVQDKQYMNMWQVRSM